MRKVTYAAEIGVPKKELDTKERSEKIALQSHVAVIGLGYVGLPLALLAEAKGFKVIGVDIDTKKISELRQKRSSVLTDAELQQLKKSRILFSSSPATIQIARSVVICVPTPVHDDHKPNLTPLKEAAEAVGKNLKAGTLVVVESTVNPGVCEEIVIPLLEKLSGLTAEKDFYFAHCPERINPGDTNYTVANIPRVIGARTKESERRAVAFYKAVLDSNVVATSLKEAESVKMVENAFRDINIAYVNELAMSFDRLGIDIHRVIEAASTKPFAFMPHFPGCGVGGHCIPVDPYYLIDYAEKNGFTHTFIKTARKINNNMPRYTVERLASALAIHGIELFGASVALLGLAYKRDISDCRESPSYEIAKELHRRGARVLAYDPYVPNESTCPSLEATLEKADAVILATDHNVFRNLNPEDLIRNNIRVIVDGRNCLSKEAFVAAGITYRGIGR